MTPKNTEIHTLSKRLHASCSLFAAMIPKHTNPSVLLNSTAIVSRAALHDSDDDDEPVEADPQHAQLLAQLEHILKRSIEDVLPPTPQPEDQDDGDRSRKKKRRKVEREQEQEETREGQVEEEAVTAVRTFTLNSSGIGTFMNAFVHQHSVFYLEVHSQRP